MNAPPTVLYVGAPMLPPVWFEALRAALPDCDFRIWPDVGNRADIEAAVVFGPTPGALSGLPNLKLVSALGLGVDHILQDPELPPGVRVVRVVAPSIVEQMGDYIALKALQAQWQTPMFDEAQRRQAWTRSAALGAYVRRDVGLLGFGMTAQRAASILVDLGFPVRAWTRTPRIQPGIDCFHGEDQFDTFLSQAHTLVCALPLTEATRGILGSATFRRLPKGAYIVNVGRGAHLVETELLDAIASGHVAGAFLDVFEVEPLPQGHPFWLHPQIRITPHCAAVPQPAESMACVAENIRRMIRGDALLDRVDPARGY